MSVFLGLASALGGMGRGMVERREQDRIREERARLQAAAELKDKIAQQRQAQQDQRAAEQTQFMNRDRLAQRAREMSAAGFTPYQSGMLDGTDANTVAAAQQMGGAMPMMAAAGEAARVGGMARGRALADEQGGYLKTGLSDQERIRQDEREARAAQQQASLTQQADLARERIAADRTKAQEANALRRDLAGIAASARSAGASSKADARAEQVSMRLRTQYENNPAVKQAYTIASQLQGVEATAQKPDAAGDLSMIYAYMKILDPSSVVRDTEFATAQNAAGVPDRVRNLYNRAMKGTRLTNEQRAEFLTRARSIGTQARTALQKQNERYGRIAGSMGVDPSLVVYDPFGELDGGGDSPSTTPVPQVPPRKPGESWADYKKRTGVR
jgi:hypothetical protein